MRRFLYRFRSVTVPEPRTGFAVGLLASFGAALAVMVVGLVSELSGAPLVMAPLGATALLLFAVPDGVMSQPRSVLVGHLFAVVAGIGFGHLLAPGWQAAAPAVFVAIAAMQATRALHAPAGATALLAAFDHHDWSFIGMPVMAGAGAMLVIAFLFHAMVPGRRYPVRWY